VVIAAKGTVNIIGRARFQGLKLHLQGSGCILRVSQLWCGACVGRVPEHGHSGDLGNHLLEDLQLLPNQLGRH